MQTKVPSQVNIAPTIYTALIDFGDGLIAAHSFNNKVETAMPWDMSIVVDGDEGSILGNFNSVTLDRKDGTKIEQTPTSKWFPDAFLGPMADLMDAITENREPIVSGRSNLGTMKLLLGALESAGRRRIVQLI
jgi:predicted dehydrogenase